MRYCHFGVSPVNYSDSGLTTLLWCHLVAALQYTRYQDVFETLVVDK